jgi:hypothetical protein
MQQFFDHYLLDAPVPVWMVVWVTYAAALTAALWRANAGVL